MVGGRHRRLLPGPPHREPAVVGGPIEKNPVVVSAAFPQAKASKDADRVLIGVKDLSPDLVPVESIKARRIPDRDPGLLEAADDLAGRAGSLLRRRDRSPMTNPSRVDGLVAAETSRVAFESDHYLEARERRSPETGRSVLEDPGSRRWATSLTTERRNADPSQRNV